jgi:O-antigen/teichoic acid export membrane protein
MKSVSTSRLFNAKRNVVSGVIKQLLGIVLSFTIRTVIIYTLGAEYQGLNGLFTSILQVLNLSDLGFSTAVTFILYKPIADEDSETICAIIAFLKKAYFIVGCVILGIGVVLIPFLPKLISGNYPNDINIYILFAIYLFNAVISYWLFAYKSTLLTAMQRDDVVSKVFMISSLSIKVVQLVLLFLFKNYYVFIVIMPIGSILNNLLLQIFSKKLFPQVKPIGKIENGIRKELVKQVKAVFVNRLSDIARNCFDDIIVSSFIGLVAVAAYDNYYYIYTAIIGIMSIIVHAIRASVGNSIVKESIEKNHNDLIKLTFIFMWVAGWFAICLLSLYQPFMAIWMKDKPEVILSDVNMTLFCVYFYCFCMTYTKGVYLEAKGLFWECRYLYVIEALGNLGLNLILGYFLGITGVLIATIITIVLFNFVGGTIVLFRFYFKTSKKEFYLLHLRCFILTAVNAIITSFVCSILPLDGIVGFIIKLIICLVMPNIIYILFYFKTKDFQNSLSIAKRMLNRLK